MRCNSPVQLNAEGLPISHQASHYFSRGREGTRFDPENVDTLCMGCHKLWGGDEREFYTAFKIKQLGAHKFKLLTLHAHTYQKKDRKLMRIKAERLLAEIQQAKGLL